MSEQIFHLPDVGEGLTEADIVGWEVAPGDTVALNQVVCEIETAKSLVELPSPFEGVVVELLAEVGQTIPVGQPILRVRTEATADGSSGTDGTDGATDADGTGGTGGAADGPPQPNSGSAATAGPTDTSEGGGAVLVGYGTSGAPKSRRVRTSSGASTTTPRPTAHTGAGAQHPTSDTTEPASGVRAKPPTRKLAKDRGIDLRDVTGTGQLGEVLRDDVLKHTATEHEAPAATQQIADGWPAEREERIPVKGMRKQIAKAMAESAFTAPHVSVFVDVDATRTMDFVQRLKTSSDFVDIRVSPLLIMAKAIIWAIRRNPMVNATFTEDEIIVHNYVNLGIAAATPRGLVVPNIKDAQQLSLRELAKAITDLTATARAGRTQPAEMQGGTITITNFGVFGIDSGTPIINPGEAGIIGMGAIRQKPWVVDGNVVPRWVTTVGGSFDHRVVDGDVISTFVADIASVIEEPALLLD